LILKGGCTYSLTPTKQLAEVSLFGEFLTKKEPQTILPSFEDNESDAEEPILGVAMIMNPNGYKKINITLNNLRLTIHAAVLYTLSGFAAMDDSVVPPEPIGKKLHLDNVAVAKNEDEELAGMDIFIDIKKMQTVISSPKAKNALAISGKILQKKLMIKFSFYFYMNFFAREKTFTELIFL
jgi:hypothetical protein